MKFSTVLFGAVIACFLSTEILFAQAGSISGVVTDESGESLPGITIRFKDSPKGVATDTTGFFVIKNIPTNIMHLNHVSGNIAIAMLFNPSGMDWPNYEGDHYYYAKINLETQEVTPYDVPASGSRLSRYPLVHDGMFYTFLKSAANSTTHVLRIDTEGGPDAYTVGAQVVGEDIKGYSIFAHPTE